MLPLKTGLALREPIYLGSASPADTNGWSLSGLDHAPRRLAQSTRWCSPSSHGAIDAVWSNAEPTAISCGRLPFALARLYKRVEKTPPQLRKRQAVSGLRDHISELVNINVDVALDPSFQFNGKALEVSLGYSPSLLPSSNLSLFPAERRLQSFCLPPVRHPFPRARLSWPGRPQPHSTDRILAAYHTVSSRSPKRRGNNGRRDFPSLITNLTGGSESVSAHAHQLMEDNSQLQTDNRELNSALHDAISQRVVVTEELQNLKKHHAVMEETLKTLWTLVKEDISEFQDITTMAEIQDQVYKISRLQVQNAVVTQRPEGQEEPDTDQKARPTSLERKLAQRDVFLEHYKRAEALSRRKAERLTQENQQLRTQLDKAEQERKGLQLSLSTTEKRLTWVEQHFPSSDRQDLAPRDPSAQQQQQIWI
ncbi:hypothetical protein M406DRAFT_69626 [Cryphonectria parasitica EP155]|uniref:Uncharacterized protein n=1 Tax=Cryphonectria parasitica (strain ATCC 38755 / EP155) TaxID=660469 RepID=A0A9P4Y6J8_CRYP1|nr:uncharacterized protein M406DRAFT_69626 [Cryphonectria parasitica EP155]KAF3767483.1 hypothetical protein M406DRAFT_69626 [Cryphonectria parasitica EP155]